MKQTTSREEEEREGRMEGPRTGKKGKSEPYNPNPNPNASTQRTLKVQPLLYQMPRGGPPWDA